MTRPLTYDDMDRLRSMYEFDPSAVRLSPTGRHVAYVVGSEGVDESAGDAARRTDLFVADVDSGESTPVVEGGRSGSPSWSSDGLRLAFYHGDANSKGLWLWDLESGEARQISSEQVLTTGPGSGPVWDPEGKKIYISLFRANLPGPPEPEPSKPEDRGRSNVEVFRSPEPHEEISFPGDEFPQSIPEIGVVDLASETTKSLLNGFPFGSFRLSLDGNWLAIAGPNRWPEKPAWRVVIDLYVARTSGGEPRSVAENLESRGRMARTAYAWSPDSRLLAYIGERKIWIFDPSTGQSRSLDAGLQLAPHFLMWSSDSRSILCFESGGDRPFDPSGDLLIVAADGSAEARRVSQPQGRGLIRDVMVLGDSRAGAFWSPDGKSCAIHTAERRTKNHEIWQLPLDGGKPSLLWSTDRWISHLEAPKGDRVVACLKDETTPGDLGGGTSFGELRQMTNLNPELEEIARGRGRPISWRDVDGAELFGYVLLPHDYQEGRRVPVIADIYPGLNGSDSGRRWNAASGVVPPQMLCGRGFAVLIPDLPGVMAAIPKPGGLAPSLVGGLNELVRLGIADPDRLGVMGQSGGGGGVNLVITQTTVFKAAVSVAGIANWSSFFGQFSVRPDGSPFMYGAGLPTMAHGGPPWEKALEYMQTSAVFHLGNVTTPLLLIHGTGDESVGAEQSGEMFAGLHSQGKKVTFLRYPGEGHVPGFFSHANRQDAMERVIAWFEEHLLAD